MRLTLLRHKPCTEANRPDSKTKHKTMHIVIKT